MNVNYSKIFLMFNALLVVACGFSVAANEVTLEEVQVLERGYKIEESKIEDNFEQEDIIDTKSWLFGASLGYGEITSHLTDEDDIGLYVLPDLRYYHDRFYIENSTIGYSLQETPRYSIELLGRANLDGIVFPQKYRNVIAAFTSQLSSRNFLGDLGPVIPEQLDEPILYPQEKELSYMLGAVGRWYFPYTNLSMSLTKDVTAGHNGFESQITSVSHYKVNELAIELQLALNYKSQRLTNYYYGVGPRDIPDGFDHLLYKPQAAINWHAQLQAAYPLSANWFLVSSLRYESWHDEIKRSPIVKHDTSLAYFSGVKWVY